jgi:transaldolase/glucose-6-phosphate isomerase
VSRIDAVIDKKIDDRARDVGPSDAVALRAIRGKVAIANAKIAYARYLELIETPRWKALADAGAAPQRLLWASTGAKDPTYSDVLYVDTLIGRETVNTMPPKTLDAFRDHGKVSASLTADLGDAKAVLAETERLGLDLPGVTETLVSDGVKKFAQAFDALLGAVADKRASMLGEKLDAQEITLPDDLKGSVGETMDKADAEGWARRLWGKDASLWTRGDEAKWLGWLSAGFGSGVDTVALTKLAQSVRSAGYGHAVLLGMGGSSLGPEVLGVTLAAGPGFPTLLTLDSTDPDQISRIEQTIDLAKTLFIVSSKSGSTLEPDILHRYFFRAVENVLGAGKAGARFIAVTDPGSNLERTARDDGFADVFHGDTTIGGRYSVLSNFGLVPAAVMGLDVKHLLETAGAMAKACGKSVPPRANPGIELGIVLGLAARAGRDKLTIFASDGIAEIGAWLEQLIAESTGKHGKGLIPLAAEPLGDVHAYSHDRVFAYLRLDGQEDPARDGLVRELEEAGHPVVRITLASPRMVVQEFFRWEIATAVVGAVLGIDPFDQPDVEASKIETRMLTDAIEKTGKVDSEQPLFEEDGLALYSDPRNAKALQSQVEVPSLEAYLGAHFSRAGDGDYVGLLAYLDRDCANTVELQAIRRRLRDGLKRATILGFGPRFLHSTGQAYKGGPNSGVFLQITATPLKDLAIPGRNLTFAGVLAAQARGDLAVLAERGRRLLRIDLGANIEGGLKRLQAAIERAIG